MQKRKCKYVKSEFQNEAEGRIAQRRYPALGGAGIN